MAWFCRILCYACFGLALVSAGGDGLRSLEEGRLVFRSVSDVWINLDEPGEIAFQNLARDWAPALWDPTLVTLMNWPSWVFLTILAIFFWILALLSSRRRPRRRFY